MNRYAAAGIVHDALDGKRIVILVPRRAEVRPAMDEVLRALRDADPDSYEVRRTNGDERIRFLSGGDVRFLSARASSRGWTADVVFLDDDVDRMLSLDDWTNLAALTQPTGEVIRA